MELSKYIPTLEAVLFAGGEPVPISRLAAALELSEVSVGCAVAKAVCSVCGKESLSQILKRDSS